MLFSFFFFPIIREEGFSCYQHAGGVEALQLTADQSRLTQCCRWIPLDPSTTEETWGSPLIGENPWEEILGAAKPGKKSWE